MFTDRVEKFIPPRKGSKHVLRVIREALHNEPAGTKTDLNFVLEQLNRVSKRRTIVFIISDFFTTDFKKMLSMTNKRHDVIAVTINDPAEYDLPDAGIVKLHDAETGEKILVDTSNSRVRKAYREEAQSIANIRQEIFKSCKLALALEELLNEEDATVMTIDCYGTMWQPLCRSYAYPCIGFARLNNIGLGGICESDLQCAMTHIIYQGLVGRPGFMSDPTVDESNNSIICAHCMGTPKMDGPDKPAAPYKLRSIMERQEGVVPQVKMRIGQKVTQAKLVGTDFLPYFTGEIIDAPVSLRDDRGCRTKITVKVDGDAEKLWKNWSSGLHRVTCYGDVTKELRMFCRFEAIKMVNEAV